ncbi:permease [Thalassotalea euphylliae]|uniref:TRAP transporter small permease protein n=1 Tax=Thalassotalea euphylliae TaxID=1655234 RepID=A0A3E0TNL4_9GAMM|nr:TRAP transporter small permease subunit [Thalassotalea euphylliae]REL25682.1 permease [Thalassotalea euphylliae]
MKGSAVFLALIDRITEGVGAVIRWLTLFMVLLTFAIVVLRYGFNIGWIAMQESVLYLHGLVFMLGAAYTLKADGHVRVDIFYQNYSAKQKALVNLVGTLVLLLPVVIFVFVASYDYVLTSWRIAEKSSEAGGLPFVYLSKTYLWLFAITLGLQGIAECLRNINILLASDDDRGEQGENQREEEATL